MFGSCDYIPLRCIHYYYTLLAWASTSTLSTPIPALPMTLRFLATFITSAVTFVPLLTISPSYFGISEIICSFVSPVFTSTTRPPAFFNISKPFSDNLSLTSTFISIPPAVFPVLPQHLYQSPSYDQTFLDPFLLMQQQ